MKKKTLIFIICSILIASCKNDSSKQELFNTSKEYSDKQDFNNSLKTLKRLIKLYPDFDSAYVERGFVRLQLNVLEKALTDLNKAIDLNNSIISGYFVRAMTYDALQDYNAAFEDYDYIIKQKDKDYFLLALNQRASLYDYFGEYEKALIDLKQLYLMDSLDVQVLTSLGVIYRRLQDDKTAMKYYNIAISINPEYSDAIHKRALIYRDSNQLDKAVQEISRAIEISPKAGTFYVSRGLIYRKMNKTDQALADLSTAIELEPDNGIAYLNRGYIKEQDLNDKISAKKDFKKAESLGLMREMH